MPSLDCSTLAFNKNISYEDAHKALLIRINVKDSLDGTAVDMTLLSPRLHACDSEISNVWHVPSIVKGPNPSKYRVPWLSTLKRTHNRSDLGIMAFQGLLTGIILEKSYPMWHISP